MTEVPFTVIRTRSRLQHHQPDREPLDLSADWRPEVDLYEDQDGFLICAALPGVAMRRIRVDSIGNGLAISGAAGMRVPPNATAHRMELPHGRFLRRIDLPVDVDIPRISAEMGDGLLLIRVPRRRAAPRVSIQVRG